MNAVRWSPEQDMIRLDVLDASQCERALTAIDALRPHWTRRNPALPFFTLGAASYIDAAASPEGYREAAARVNPLLREHFGWLLERAGEALGRALGGPVEWHPAAALPGFHIYLAHPMFAQPIASIHCDSQYELVDWSACGEPDFAAAASFTLALALPRHGGGLNVWELRRDDIRGLDNAGIAARVRAAPRHYHAYAAGTMALHSGNVMHQAAPGRDIAPDDRRITLQGHCLFAGGRWYAYW